MSKISDLDIIDLAGTRAKGARPYYFNDPDSDRLLSIVMAVAMEHAVTRQRLDALERLIEAKGLLSRQELDDYVPDRAAEGERGVWTQEYIARILRFVQQETETLRDGVDVDIHAVQDELR